MELDLPLILNGDGTSLCYKCSRISLDTVVVSNGLGFYHSDRLEDVVDSASRCAMCKLICEGLFADIADKFDDDPFTPHHGITIQPDVHDVTLSNSKKSLQAGLRIWSRWSHANCIFNWYLPYKAALSSPVRPQGLQKLDFAKLWLRQSLQDFDKYDPKNEVWGAGSAEKTGKLLHSTSNPTRLLDLGSQGYDAFGDVRLTSYSEGLPYVSLSHRWGSSQHLTTTHTNYKQHMLGIQFRKLPKTFQDAVTVARYLGIRYLWVDALCIIQDDRSDWHREALLMGKVYQGSTCTIAVHDAGNDSEGFLENCLRPPVTISLGSIRDDTNSTVSLRSNFKAAVGKSALSRRGWVIQERFLSPRTLHFTEKSIFFEDGHGVVTEEDGPSAVSSNLKLLTASLDIHSTADPSVETFLDPSTEVAQTSPLLGIGTGSSWKRPNTGHEIELSEKIWPAFWSPKKSHNRAFNLQACILKSGDYQSTWFELLEKYSDTQLTFDSDKLPAISGLVRFFQRHTKDCFVSGIWGESFHIGLLWTAYRSPARRPKMQRGASWSWVSMDGAIHHPRPSEGYLSPESRLEMDIVSERGEYIDSICPLTLSARIRRFDHLTPVLPEEMPPFFRRSVNVYRMIRTKKPKPLIWFSPEKIEEERQKCETNVGPIGFAALDYENMYENLLQIWCVEIAKFGDRSWVLLVAPILSTCYWRRVGMGLVEPKDIEEPWFDNLPTVKVTII